MLRKGSTTQERLSNPLKTSILEEENSPALTTNKTQAVVQDK
jgi:hypothetical protein